MSTRRRFSLLAIVIALTAMNSGLYGQEKDTAQLDSQIELELVWEKEFESPVLNFSLTEMNGIPTLEVVITTDKVQFFTGKNVKEIQTKSYEINWLEGWRFRLLCSKNGDYIGIRKDHYGDYGRIKEGSEFQVYDKIGNLLTTRKVTNNYQPFALMNNGAFLVTGVLEDASIVLEQLNGAKEVIFDYPDMRPSTYIGIAPKGNAFALNVSGIGVMLYDDTGKEVWKRNIENSHAAGIGISEHGSYIACFGKKWGNTLFLYSLKGNMLWEKPIGAGTHFISFSPDEKFLAVYATWSGIWFFSVKEGKLLWRYPSDKIGKKINSNFTRSIYSLDIAINGAFVVCADGGGTRELPAGDTSVVLLFDKKGKIVWQNDLKIQKERAPIVRFTDDGKYLIVCNSNKLYCYKIVGGG